MQQEGKIRDAWMSIPGCSWSLAMAQRITNDEELGCSGLGRRGPRGLGVSPWPAAGSSARQQPAGGRRPAARARSARRRSVSAVRGAASPRGAHRHCADALLVATQPRRRGEPEPRRRPGRPPARSRAGAQQHAGRSGARCLAAQHLSRRRWIEARERATE